MKSKIAAVGWDAHRRFSQVTMRDADAKIVGRQRIEHADRSGFREILSRWPAEVPVVIEATFGWGWIVNELIEVGLEPRLASTNKMSAWRKARGLPKSNRLDADLLSEVPFEKTEWWRVWVPPIEVRDARELLRHRMALVKMQTSLKNRMHALLHRHGILHDFSDLFGAGGRRFLQRLVGGADERLRATGRATLKSELQLLDALRRQIAQATRAFRKRVEADANAKLLMTLPGVSWILAYTLLAEIGDIGRFPNGKHLASYALLAPIAHDSGDKSASAPGRHVGWIGRDTLKWAYIEAARSAVRCDARFREIFNRRTDNGRRDRNRGYIAVARQMAMVTYSMWRHQQAYSATPPQRPGSEKRRRSRRDKA